MRGAEPLRLQRVAQAVDLEQRERERVVGHRAARAKGEVALAQRGEHVGQRLEGPDDPLAYDE